MVRRFMIRIQSALTALVLLLHTLLCLLCTESEVISLTPPLAHESREWSCAACKKAQELPVLNWVSTAHTRAAAGVTAPPLTF